MFLYIHGFLSSSKSTKAQVLKQWLEATGRGDEWCCPDLPVSPLEAVRLLSNIIETEKSTVKLVGSSLGGFYATVLAEKYDLKAVVINPAVHPATLLKPAIGSQKSWYSDEVHEFTQQHIHELAALDILKPKQPDNIFLMQEKGDEVIDWQDSKAFYRDCHQLIFNGGDHSFTRYTDVLVLIDCF